MAERYLDVRGRGRTMTTRERGRTSSISVMPDFSGSDLFGIVFEDEEQAERRDSILSTALRSRAATMRSRLNTISSTVDGKEVEIPEEPKTNWRSVYIITFIGMFNGIQYSVFFPSLWPFLHKVDSDATSTFFGVITASYCLTQAICGPFFGMWMNRSGSIKYPLGTGIALMGLFNILYACIEMFPENQRRFVMLAARAGVGIGSGSLGVTRAYAAMGSTVKDRAKTISLMATTYVIGLTAGPALQFVFTPINDGFYIGSFHVSEFTVPAIFATIIDSFSVIILFTMFKEDYSGLIITEAKDDPYFVLPSFNKLAAAVCISAQFTLMFVVTNLEAIGSMYTMAMFDWTDEEATRNNSIIQAAYSGFSMIMYVAFVVKLGELVSHGYERIFVIIGLSLMVLYHVITYPFPFLPNKVDEKVINNETVGCISDYDWCGYTKQVNFWVYSVTYVCILSISAPLLTIPANTLYSKVLGSRPQGIMQSIQATAGSLARTIGPLVMTTVFDEYGPEAIWGIEIGVLLATIAFWVICYRVVVPLEINPVLKPGEYYKYKKGYKYRF